MNSYTITDQSMSSLFSLAATEAAVPVQVKFRLCIRLFVISPYISVYSSCSFLPVFAGYYTDDRSRFPYERRPQSRAYMAPGEGDFYYCGGAFGGLMQEVHLLAKTCRFNFEADAKENIEAAWQEESHLNR